MAAGLAHPASPIGRSRLIPRVWPVTGPRAGAPSRCCGFPIVGKPGEHALPEIFEIGRTLYYMSFTPIAHEAGALALTAQKGKEFLGLFNGDEIEIATW